MGRWVVAALVSLLTGVAAPPARAEGPFGGADLTVKIESFPSIAQPGQTITYRVTVGNAGPGDAVLPVLTVRIPRDVEIMSVDVAECQPGRGYNEVVCRSPRDILAGGKGGVTITGLVRPSATGPLRAQATLVSEVVDADEQNNRVNALTKVDDGADLAVRLVPARRAAHPGEEYAVDAVVHNRGPREVRDAIVYVQSGRARFLTGTGARCQLHANLVGCTLPPIRSGASARFQLAFRAPERPVRTQATVYSRDLGDRRPANNQAHLRLAVPLSPAKSR
ncbi:hypothetical protein GCM10009555_106670 [Acrocarpospora macrocephala]|uniref:DUF11 domain-containing protein n=1 Tax=Acrocarpospora macrocephala TaxID=150177 RepID=A0A5M3X739_9ACTN|nr:CARDB domain-containing protein [Acrocarpospora macrocephala]GES15411.1 hypothetical protein Amac_090080 [Acrocarpospora macrocephala]